MTSHMLELLCQDVYETIPSRWCRIMRYDFASKNFETLAERGSLAPPWDPAWPYLGGQRHPLTALKGGMARAKPLRTWLLEQNQVGHLPLLDYPSEDVLCAILLRQARAMRDVLWLFRQEPLNARESQSLTDLVDFRSRPEFSHAPWRAWAEVTLRGTMKKREEASHLIRGRLATRLLMLWLDIRGALGDQAGDPRRLQHINDEIERLRLDLVEPLGRALYPAHVQWGLVTAMEAMAMNYGVTVKATPHLVQQDVALKNPVPIWIRVVVMDLAEGILREALSLSAPIAEMAVDLHPPSRVHLRFKTPTPITLSDRYAVEQWTMLSTVRVLGGEAHVPRRDIRTFLNLCLPY